MLIIMVSNCKHWIRGRIEVGFRFRKSINLGGGFRITLSKSGIGYSWGVKGYRITKTARGAIRRTASIPGTGISYQPSFHSRGSITKSRWSCCLKSWKNTLKAARSAFRWCMHLWLSSMIPLSGWSKVRRMTHRKRRNCRSLYSGDCFPRRLRIRMSN